MSVVENSNEEHVQCSVCMKEIPASEAKNAEAADYVAHFCGLDCYEKWMQEADKQEATD